MKKIIYLLLITICFGVFAEDKVIRVTGHPDYPPTIWFSSKDGKLKGVVVELLEKIFEGSTYKLDFLHVTTWGRALEEVNTGRIDILLPPYLNEERKKLYYFSDKAFLEDRTVLFVKRGSKLEYNKLEDLSKFQGTAIINDSFGDEFDKVSEKVLKVQRLSKTEQCFNFLLKGRADYLVAGYSAGLSVAKSMGIEDKIIIYPKPIIKTGMFIALSKKSKISRGPVMKLINDRLDELEKTDLIKKLEVKYEKIYQEE